MVPSLGTFACTDVSLQVIDSMTDRKRPCSSDDLSYIDRLAQRIVYVNGNNTNITIHSAMNVSLRGREPFCCKPSSK